MKWRVLVLACLWSFKSLAQEEVIEAEATEAVQTPAFGLAQPGVTKKKKKKMVKKKMSRPAQRSFGLALSAGYEALYGNGVIAALPVADFLELQTGAGYNRSGAKLGVGLAMPIHLSESFGFLMACGVVYSMGTSGKVSQEGTLEPDDGSTQKVIATKTYHVSPGVYGGAGAGGFYALTSQLRLFALVNYNHVLSGNDIKYDSVIEYDTPVEVTNEEEFNRQFEEKGKSIVTAGGAGAYGGLMLFF